MSDQRLSRRKTYPAAERPPFERIALILQGGGALESHQAGVYQALAKANRAAAKLLAKVPKDLLQTPEAEMLAAEAEEKVYNVIQLIYRSKNYEGTSKD